MHGLYPVLHQLRDASARGHWFALLLVVLLLTTSILHRAISGISGPPGFSDLIVATICIIALFATGIVLSRGSWQMILQPLVENAGASFELGSRAEGGAIARISVPWCEAPIEPRPASLDSWP